MTVLLGRPLVVLDNLQLQKEADLRYHLIQTRETAEAIATTGAFEDRSAIACRARLNDVVSNNKRIIEVTRNLGFFTNGYNYLTQLIPLLIVAPMYMQGRVEFGVVTQSAMAFSAFLSGFSLIVTQFETLSSFAAVTTRLDTIAEALEQSRTAASSPIQVVDDESRVAFEDLSLWSRHEHRPLLDGLSLEVVHGSNLLDHRPGRRRRDGAVPGDGRVLGGGEGRIIRPGPEGISFVPKQALTIRCTLRSQLLETSPARRFVRRRDPGGARQVGLAATVQRVGGLDADVHRPSALSPAEQRLLVFARVLLAVPAVRVHRPNGGRAQRRADRQHLPPAPRGLDQLPQHRRQPSAGVVPRPGAGGPRRGAMEMVRPGEPESAPDDGPADERAGHRRRRPVILDGPSGARPSSSAPGRPVARHRGTTMEIESRGVGRDRAGVDRGGDLAGGLRRHGPRDARHPGQGPGGRIRSSISRSRRPAGRSRARPRSTAVPRTSRPGWPACWPRDGMPPFGPVKIVACDRRELVFETMQGSDGTGGDGGKVRHGRFRFTPAGSRTRIEYAIEIPSGRVMLALGWLFIVLGLAALVAGCWLMFTYVVPSPNPQVRGQAFQIFQAIHFLWPPFLFASLARQPARIDPRRGCSALVHNLPYS